MQLGICRPRECQSVAYQVQDHHPLHVQAVQARLDLYPLAAIAQRFSSKLNVHHLRLPGALASQSAGQQFH